MKYFIITIDTEGDNLWAWKPGDPITTENVLYLQRFQNLANKYGFKPVYLSNYEMLNDSRFIDFILKVEEQNSGELGMHLHAWNTPPDYKLKIERNGAPYLIEYPVNVMEAKIITMTELITNKTGIAPVSHRAGRWAMNRDYYDLLIRHGYKIDCSVTPHVDWSKHQGQTLNSKGSNYSNFSEQYYKINSILEVPVTVRKTHKFFMPPVHNAQGLVKAALHSLKGQNLWLRPNGTNLPQMKYLLNFLERDPKTDYAMFMLHSSEMMPGGSPTFKTPEAIEKMYKDTEELFCSASRSFQGITLRNFLAEL